MVRFLENFVNLVTDNMHYGILPLNAEAISKLKTKHPEAVNPEPEILLPDNVPNNHLIKFESISAREVQEAALGLK